MKVGFIGLSNVGSQLSGSLLRNGVDLTVYDLDPTVCQRWTQTNAKLTQTAAQVMQATGLSIVASGFPAQMQDLETEAGDCEIILQSRKPSTH